MRPSGHMTQVLLKSERLQENLCAVRVCFALPAGKPFQKNVLFDDLFAFFPELHVLHFFPPGALQFLAGQRRAFFQIPFFAVFFRGKAVAREVFAGNDLEDLAAFKTCDGTLFDRFAGISLERAGRGGFLPASHAAFRSCLET